MANPLAGLQEAAFTIPGTKQKVPRWALFVVGGGLIAVLLFMKSKGSTAAADGEEEPTEEGGALGGLEDLIDELTQAQLPEPSEMAVVDARDNAPHDPGYSPVYLDPGGAFYQGDYQGTAGLYSWPVDDGSYKAKPPAGSTTPQTSTTLEKSKTPTTTKTTTTTSKTSKSPTPSSSPSYRQQTPI